MSSAYLRATVTTTTSGDDVRWQRRVDQRRQIDLSFTMSRSEFQRRADRRIACGTRGARAAHLTEVVAPHPHRGVMRTSLRLAALRRVPLTTLALSL